MPSDKTPGSLGIGPGLLPANVVSASALTTTPREGVPSSEVTPAIVSVRGTTALERLGSQMLVFVDSRAFIQTVAGALLSEGQTFTVNDGVNPPTVFEFDSNGSVGGGNVPVPFTSALSASEMALNIMAAINGVGVSLIAFAESTSGAVVSLSNDIYRATVITETVANAGFVVRSSSTAITITMPASPKNGDVITFVQMAPTLVPVALDGSFNDPIDGSIVQARLSGAFGVRSFVCSGPADGWTTLHGEPTVQEAHGNITLLRGGKRLTVLCDASAAGFTVTLPSNSYPGDLVTVVRTLGTNTVDVGGGGESLIDGGGTTVDVGGISYLAYKTFLSVDQDRWVVFEEDTKVLEISNGGTVNVNARETVFFVRTSAGTWNNDTLTITPARRVGDIVTVVDADGESHTGLKMIPVAVSGGGTIDGLSTIRIAEGYGSVRLRYIGSNNYVIEARSGHTQSRVETSTSLSLVRRSGFFTVAVHTASGGWTDAATITLPDPAVIGDIVVVVDADGDITNESLSTRKHITVVPATGTIDGASSAVIGSGRGAMAFQYVGAATWISVLDSQRRNAVFNVFSSSLTLPRVSASTLVRVNPGGGGWDATDVITLPTDAVLGDRVTICQANLGDGGDKVRVQPGAGSTINGYLTEYSVPLHVGTAPNVGVTGAATFRKVSSTVWLVESQCGPNDNIEVSNNTNLIRTSANMIVRVFTGAGTWSSSSDKITLPNINGGCATPGDRVTIIDASGSAHLPDKKIVVAGGFAVDGVAEFSIDWAWGSVTFILSTGGNWVACGYGGLGRLLGRTKYTSGSSATHNLNARTRFFRVRGQGPGGGGGAVDGDGPGEAAAGAAGEAGGYFEHAFTRVSGVNSFTFSVGQGGAGGDGSGVKDGASGSGPTQVSYGGVTVGGHPGAGGPGMSASGGVFLTFVPSAASGLGIIGTPDIGVPPTPGAAGMILSDAAVASGAGGSSVLARGGSGVATTGSGVNGRSGLLGGGGSGAVVGSSTQEPDGGAGGNGILIVEEYS